MASDAKTSSHIEAVLECVTVRARLGRYKGFKYLTCGPASTLGSQSVPIHRICLPETARAFSGVAVTLSVCCSPEASYRIHPAQSVNKRPRVLWRSFSVLQRDTRAGRGPVLAC